MSKRAKIKVWLKRFSALAFAMVIVGPVMQAVAAEVIDVDAGPGVLWIAQGQSGDPIIQVQIGDILVFNQASTFTHGLRIDNEAFVQRCHESESDKPDAVLVELPGCVAVQLSNVFKDVPGIQQNSKKKPFVLLRVVRRFDNTINFRCNFHDTDGQMVGQLVMH